MQTTISCDRPLLTQKITAKVFTALCSKLKMCRGIRLPESRAGNKVLNMPGQDVHASCILAGHLQDLAGHVSGPIDIINIIGVY